MRHIYIVTVETSDESAENMHAIRDEISSCLEYEDQRYRLSRINVTTGRLDYRAAVIAEETR